MLTEAQYESIIRYLDDEFSVEEEMLFIRQLTSNEELQEAFDLELMLRAQRAEQADEEVNDKDDIAFEPAHKFLERVQKSVTAVIKNKGQSAAETPVISLWIKRKIASVAAAVILIFGVSVFYYFRLNEDRKVVKNNSPQLHEKSIHRSRDTTYNQTPKNVTGELSDNYLADISKNFYKRYKQNEHNPDPFEVSLYYDDYSDKKFQEVIQASESDYETKGSSNDQENKSLQQYMLFYKALSYIETAKPAKAIVLLNTISKENDTNSRLHYHAQYYLLMAYMMLNDRKNTESIVTMILNDKNNPNTKTALEINNLIKKK